MSDVSDTLVLLPPVKARTYDTDPREATRATVVQMSKVFFIMLLVAMCVGVTMSWIFYFRSYDSQFARLRAEDLNISQGIYNETIARIAKDMILMTKQASLQALLDADIAARKAEQGFVNETLLNDTAARISGFAAIAEGLEEEIVGRQLNDTILQQDIDNATATITQIVTFNNYSLAEFMVLMANITDISSDIIAETATRTAEQNALLTQQIILANSLTILVAQLNNEIATRIAQDQSIQQMLEDATFNLIYTINGLPPLNGTIVLQSLNPVFVTVSNGPAVNEVFVTNNGILTFNNIAPDGLGNFQIIAGQGIVLSYPVANLVQISTVSGSIVGTNRYATSAVYPYGQETCWINNGGNVGGNFCNQEQDEVLVRVPTNSFPLGHCSTNSDCLAANNPNIVSFQSQVGHPLSWFCGATPLGPYCLAPCTADNDCQKGYGNSWRCALSFSGVNYCQNNQGCSDESECSQARMLPYTAAFFPLSLGDQWRCISNRCRRLFCYYDTDCSNAFGVGQPWQCWNGRCVGPGWNQNQWQTFPNGYGTTGSPPGNAQSFQWTSAPRNAFTNCPSGQTGNYICPQPLLIRGNQEPYSGFGIPGGFSPTFLGSSNGFYIPIGYDSTWLVRCTITINILWNNYQSNKNQYWLMFINRGLGWEQTDVNYDGKYGPQLIPVGGTQFNPDYITLQTTVIMDSATHGQGTPLYMGYQVIWYYGCFLCDFFTMWHSMDYEITRLL